MYNAGIYVTIAAFPLVPRSQVGFRVQMTAANTEDEIDELCHALRALFENFALQRRHD